MSHLVWWGKIYPLQFCLTITGHFFPLTVGPVTVSVSLGHSCPPLSRFQVPSGKVEWHLSFWKSWWKNSPWVYFKQNDPALVVSCSLTCSLPCSSSLHKRNSRDKKKLFSLLSCSTFNVPQVINNMRLFSPWDGQECTSECSLECLSAGLQEQANSGVENRRAWATRWTQSPANPAVSKPSAYAF